MRFDTLWENAWLLHNGAWVLDNGVADEELLSRRNGESGGGKDD
jgi:hypothetical protein